MNEISLEMCTKATNHKGNNIKIKASSHILVVYIKLIFYQLTNVDKYNI